jgi:phosphate transport system substrate-binding protein
MQLSMSRISLFALLVIPLSLCAGAQQKPSRGLNAPAAPTVAPSPGLARVNSQRVQLLPAYDNHGDSDRLHGILRIHGTELTQHLIHAWEDGFLKQHPLTRFEDKMWPTGFSGLAEDTADVNVMGHDAWYSDLKALEAQWGYDPEEIQFATGGFNLRKGNTPATIFFVNRENPLSRLTIDEIDGIFGAERNGGWKGTKWDTSVARGPEKNIRTWGQLGLKGEWADMRIHVYGLDATLSNWSKMVQVIAFHGGDKWNEQMKEIVRGGV